MQVHSDVGSVSPKTAQLKAQIANELRNKQRCAYSTYKCSQLALPKYDYCINHILSDKSAPYKTCSYVYPTGKRCYLPALKSSKKDYVFCHDHALKTHLASTKSTSKVQPSSSAEALLYSLAHHIKVSKPKTSVDEMRYPQQEEEVPRTVDPFALDAKKVLSGNDMLEMHSDSDSDYESSNFSNIWADADAESSNDETNDIESLDVLKHSDIFTAEQVTLITRDKLAQLQSLYIDQYKHLSHVLKEKRRRYYHSLKREKETCCSIYNQTKDNPKEQEMYAKLKAHRYFHRKRGVEAILRKKLNDLRMKINDGMPSKPQAYYAKCAFSEGGVKCTEKALPIARHCRKHILRDPNQVLFKACGQKNADVLCETPVEANFEDQHCILHKEVPILKVYSQLRQKDSESDNDEVLLDAKPKIKSEIDTDGASNSPASFTNTLNEPSTSCVKMEESN